MKANRAVRAVTLAVSMAASAPAMALTPDEAEAVIGIMEHLTAEIGETMSTESGGKFYDYDSMDGALIAAQGFSRESWVVAYDAVMAGYLAVMPEAQFRMTFEEPLALLDNSELPEEQKAMMRAHIGELMAEAQALRNAGAAHADVVRPYEQRLYPLVYGAD